MSTSKPTHLNLPPVEDQLLKFAHLRYKVVPILSGNNEEGDEERFFEQVNLPKTMAYAEKTGEFQNLVFFPNGGFTAAFKVDPDAVTTDIGISKCNLDDVYVKEEGRVRAEGRFNKGVKSTHNSRFDTFVCLDISDLVAEAGDEPVSAIVRGAIINELSQEIVKEVRHDMSMIRAMIALQTDVPFFVELS